MSEFWLTTFASRRDFERVREIIERAAIAHQIIEPPAWLEKVALPALVLGRAERNRLAEAAGGHIPCSGWVDFKGPARIPEEPARLEPQEDIFGEASITIHQPCVADDTKIRFVGELGGNLGPVFPYLNAVIGHASFSPQAENFTYLDRHRLVVLYPRRVTVAKADDLFDAWVFLERLRRLCNHTWARRAEIEPCYVTRKKPPALEIFKRLPGTNCGLCGELTCMAFALRLWGGETELARCQPIFLPENRALRAALFEICAGLGVKLPAEDEEKGEEK